MEALASQPGPRDDPELRPGDGGDLALLYEFRRLLGLRFFVRP